MNFVEYSTALMAEGVTLAEMARVLGISTSYLSRARLDPSNYNYRPPPKGWEERLERFTAERISRLAPLTFAASSSP